MENIIQQDAPDPGTYSNQPTYTDRELRATEYSVHKLNQLFHLIFVALERSTFPTLYLKQTFDAGVAVNTSGNYISAAGHPFEAYDRVKYTSLGTAIAELDREVYWIHPNTTADRIYLAEYIDGEVRELTAGTPSQIHTLEVERDAGVDRVPITYGIREIPTPVNSGMDLADVIYGATTGAYAEIVRVEDNLAEIMYQVKYLALNNFSAANVGGLSFQNGETVVVQGATANAGTILATDNATYIKMLAPQGTFTTGNTIEGVTTGATADYVSEHDRILVNFRQGKFIATDKIFSVNTSSKATALIVRNNNGALIDNQAGRITYDIETVTGEFKPQDVIYGSVTDQIIEIESFQTLPNFGEYVHGRDITRVTYSQLITDTGVVDTFEVGDTIQILSGGIQVGWTATVTELDTNNNYVYLCNITGEPEGVTISDIASNSTYTLAKIPPGSLFPSVYTQAGAVTITATSAYGKIAKITQFGTRAVLALEGTQGTFQKNAPDYW